MAGSRSKKNLRPKKIASEFLASRCGGRAIPEEGICSSAGARGPCRPGHSELAVAERQKSPAKWAGRGCQPTGERLSELVGDADADSIVLQVDIVIEPE